MSGNSSSKGLCNEPSLALVAAFKVAVIASWEPCNLRSASCDGCTLPAAAHRPGSASTRASMGDNTLDIGAGSHVLAARLHRRLRSLQRAAQALAQRALLVLPRGAWAERRGVQWWLCSQKPQQEPVMLLDCCQTDELMCKQVR